MNFLFKERSHEDDKLTLKSPSKMILEQFRHKISITTENSSKKEEQSWGLNRSWYHRNSTVSNYTQHSRNDKTLKLIRLKMS